MNRTDLHNHLSAYVGMVPDADLVVTLVEDEHGEGVTVGEDGVPYIAFYPDSEDLTLTDICWYLGETRIALAEFGMDAPTVEL